MKEKKARFELPAAVDGVRRKVLAALAAGGLLALPARAAQEKDADTLRFPGDPPENLVVYQFNHAESDYHDHIIFSVGALLRQYGDNIKIVVTAFGPGIHILLKQPRRPVSKSIREKVASLADYGVEFHACGNTLKSLNLTEKDLLPFAKLVEVGAADLMELQKKGYAYISW
jgi:hypothetical protein